MSVINYGLVERLNKTITSLAMKIYLTKGSAFHEIQLEKHS